jgi:cellulose 1,4-beta-cellobiosidase
VTADGTDTGDLSAVQRFYVQNGNVYANPSSDLPGLPSYNSITDNTCTTQKTLFGDVNQFAAKGGLTAVGKLLDRGVVLTLSLWDDYDVNMLWLDSSYPLTSSPSAPGVLRGPCPTTSGAPANVESQYPNANVKYMNIAVGTIGSTFVSAASSGATAAPPTASPATNNPTPAQTTAASATGGNCATTVAEYGACTTAPGCCAASTQCFQQSIYYAQCLTSCPPSGWTCNILT